MDFVYMLSGMSSILQVSTDLEENKFPLFNHQPSVSTHIVTLPSMHIAGEIGLLGKYREGQNQVDNPNSLTGSTRDRLEIKVQMMARETGMLESLAKPHKTLAGGL